ncbi:VanZ family protein [Pseudalkalibacillus berkeleyi]|uniref:VanZ family protein n=1 Tax=Pseudalkalibacillus berkeleyi TaxID=1069813 RepID=A0ABS9H1E6_9BACL|nr:VanZ family protein [Pseudalkalibacillus berkeleyi]MCF6138807.1 VanZ family protein [Pseudalkalibacillus berkeleyi]
MNKILSWSFVFLWMSLIFYLSHQPATASNAMSTGLTEMIVQFIEGVTPVQDFDLEAFNHIVRKNAHFFAYFILGLLVLNALRKNRIRKKEIGFALLICVLYASSDEVHQLFVPGRGAQINDVLIDSSGAIVGVSLYTFVHKIRHPNTNI